MYTVIYLGQIEEKIPHAGTSSLGTSSLNISSRIIV